MGKNQPGSKTKEAKATMALCGYIFRSKTDFKGGCCFIKQITRALYVLLKKTPEALHLIRYNFEVPVTVIIVYWRIRTSFQVKLWVVVIHQFPFYFFHLYYIPGLAFRAGNIHQFQQTAFV